MYFASTFAIQICAAAGCAILRSTGRGGSVLPTVPGLPACCQPRVAGPCPCHGLAGPKSRAEQGCLPPRAAAEHWEGVAGLSDTI